MLSFIFKSKPNYVNFGLLIYRLALGISMFYHGYLKWLSGSEGLYKVGAMLAPLGVPGGYEILGTTDIPEVRPSRSSRTKDSLSQISNARSG